MTEVVSFEGQFGMRAILRALDNVRIMLETSDIDPHQAAGYLGCLNYHLAQLVGERGAYWVQLRECGGMVCPECKFFIGFVSNLSEICPHCGKRFFPDLADEHVYIRPGGTT